MSWVGRKSGRGELRSSRYVGVGNALERPNLQVMNSLLPDSRDESILENQEKMRYQRYTAQYYRR